MLARHAWAAALLHIDAWRARSRWRPLDLARPAAARAYRRVARDAGGTVLVLLRVGRWVECFGAQRLLAQQVLSLRPARIARFGFALTAGVPAAREAVMVARALERRQAVLRLRRGRLPALLGAAMAVGRAPTPRGSLPRSGCGASSPGSQRPSPGAVRQAFDGGRVGSAQGGTEPGEARRRLRPGVRGVRRPPGDHGRQPGPRPGGGIVPDDRGVGSE